MSNTLRAWLDNLLLQNVAECYLDGFQSLNADELRNRFRLGNNNPEFFPSGDPLVSPNLPGKTRLTDSQITYFTSNWEVIDHRGNNDERFATLSAENVVGNGTGFSATLMRNRATGEYTLAIRSTEYADDDRGGDWSRDGIEGADGELFARGFALGQLAALEEYYAFLRSSGALPAGAVLDVSGYSLGGHLAAVFAEAHPEVRQGYTFNAPGRGSFDAAAGSLTDMLAYFRAVLANPSAAVGEVPIQEGQAGWSEYQAAQGAQGGTWPASLYADSRYRWAQIATQQHFRTSNLALPPGSTDPALNGRITALYGRASHGDGEWVANAGIHAAATQLFIEDQPDIQGLGVGWLGKLLGVKSDFGTTHSITLLADSLAVMELLQRLDPAANAGKLYNLLSAGSNKRASGLLLSDGKGESDSLEKIVEALRKLVTGIDIALPVAEIGGGFGNLSNRNAYYQALDAISAALGSAPTGYRLASLAGVSASELVSKAEQKNAEGLAWRYALREGNAFALVHDEALYAQHNQNGELNLFDLATGQGALTEKWIESRAAYLERRLYYNVLDARYDSRTGTAAGDGEATRFDGEDIVWEDRESGTTIRRGEVTASTRHVVFGSDGDDRGSAAIVGGNKNDLLYGGAGEDELKGGGDKDYLEGGAGIDVLEGGDDNDTLVGGAGDDKLYGGTGHDTYIVGQGTDTIVDEDGLGVVRDGQGRVIAGVFVQGADGRYTWIQNAQVGATHNSPLTITLENGAQVIIENYDDFDGGVLGIDLVDAAPPAQTTRTIRGDRQWRDFYGDAVLADGGSFSHVDSQGRDVYTVNHPVVPADWLYAQAVGGEHVVEEESDTVVRIRLTRVTYRYHLADELGNPVTTEEAVAVADELYGSEQNDLIDSGAGDDEVQAKEGADRVELGDGDDHGQGGAGADTLVGGAGRDILFGESGDDTLYANQARDPLAAFALGQS